MNTMMEKIEGGIWGLLVGDALGVPFEFCHHASLPDLSSLDYELPKGYAKSHPCVPVGTWSDDGAQALCLLTSLMDHPQLNLDDFSSRLLDWYDRGFLCVDGFAFDVGNQTSVALNRLKSGRSPEESGLAGKFNNGNGSLMRCLPIALLCHGSDEELIGMAHRQSLVTHAHKRSLVCCALYVIWARREIEESADPWEDAVETLRDYYRNDPTFLYELEEQVLKSPFPRTFGGSYVVDTLMSVRIACREPNYEAVVKQAIRFGNDTDTVAALAGGIAGLRHRMRGIPYRWKSRLRGLRLLFPIMQQLCLRLERTQPKAHPSNQPDYSICMG
jgi:ADP-ribosyl-[dinitrogen reductase] hydrolase